MKKNMWSNVAVVGLSVMMLFSSCASKKKVAEIKNEPETVAVPVRKNAAKEELISATTKSNFVFTTFSGKAKAKVDFYGSNYDATVNIRIQKDKKIWMSITALLGIEAARVLITPDSVQILNKFQKEYISKPFSYLYQFSSKELTFSQVQDLFMGNVNAGLLDNPEDVNIVQKADNMELSGLKSDLNFVYQIGANKKMQLMELAQPSKNQKIQATYANYNNSLTQLFPQLIKIMIAGQNREFDLQLDFSQINLNVPVETPFSVSSNYKVVK